VGILWDALKCLELHILHVNYGLVVKSHFVSCLYLVAIEISRRGIVKLILDFGNLGGHFGFSLKCLFWVEPSFLGNVSKFYVLCFSTCFVVMSSSCVVLAVLNSG
jgi:hypothetical protein